MRKGILVLLAAVLLLGLLAACGDAEPTVTIETAKPAATPKPTPEPTPEPTLQALGPAPAEEAQAPDRAGPAADPTPTPAPERDYVINTNTGKFHVPSCSSVKDIKPGNRSDVHMTRDAVIAQGWQPCGKCKP